MIGVFLADDHAVVRRGLQRMLESTGQMTVVGAVGDGLSGAELPRRVRERRPELPVIVLSTYAEDAVGLQLLRDGAAAYLSKHRPPEEL